jgi:hypothetical protein
MNMTERKKKNGYMNTNGSLCAEKPTATEQLKGNKMGKPTSQPLWQTHCSGQE